MCSSLLMLIAYEVQYNDVVSKGIVIQIILKTIFISFDQIGPFQKIHTLLETGGFCFKSSWRELYNVVDRCRWQCTRCQITDLPLQMGQRKAGGNKCCRNARAVLTVSRGVLCFDSLFALRCAWWALCLTIITAKSICRERRSNIHDTNQRRQFFSLWTPFLDIINCCLGFILALDSYSNPLSWHFSWRDNILLSAATSLRVHVLSYRVLGESSCHSCMNHITAVTFLSSGYPCRFVICIFWIFCNFCCVAWIVSCVGGRQGCERGPRDRRTAVDIGQLPTAARLAVVTLWDTQLSYLTLSPALFVVQLFSWPSNHINEWAVCYCLLTWLACYVNNQSPKILVARNVGSQIEPCTCAWQWFRLIGN